MAMTIEDLQEAKRQIDSTLYKLRKALASMEAKAEPARYKSQITLAKRRIAAFEIAVALIEQALENKGRRA